MPAPRWWIKLWIEILHDPKMGMMPDHVWRKAVEFFLVAGEINEDGNLHTAGELAWRLKGDEADMIQVLRQLEKAGIVEHLPDGGWRVRNFVKRNEALDDATRKKLSRKWSQREGENGHTNVTKRDTETDKESDSDIEKDSLSVSAPVQEFLKLAGMKKFPKGAENLLTSVAGLIQEHGAEKTLACARWLWKKSDMTLERAVSSMQTAVPSWTIEKAPNKGNGNGNGHKPVSGLAEELARREAMSGNQ